RRARPRSIPRSWCRSRSRTPPGTTTCRSSSRPSATRPTAEAERLDSAIGGRVIGEVAAWHGGRHIVVVVENEAAPQRSWIITAYRLAGWPVERSNGREASVSVRPRGGHPAHQRAPPYPEQHTEELGDDVVARINPLTGGI